MAIKEISRRFDAHQAAWIVELENSLGVKHVLTIHVADPESCPHCGQPLKNKGGAAAVDVDADIRSGIRAFAAHEKRLLPHAREHARRQKPR